jgi:hypothetical protein
MTFPEIANRKVIKFKLQEPPNIPKVCAGYLFGGSGDFLEIANWFVKSLK